MESKTMTGRTSRGSLRPGALQCSTVPVASFGLVFMMSGATFAAQPVMVGNEQVLPPCGKALPGSIADMIGELHGFNLETVAPAGRAAGAPSVDAPKFVPQAASSGSDIRCRPTLATTPNRVADFDAQSPGPPVALVVDSTGKIYQTNRAAGIRGSATNAVVKKIRTDDDQAVDFRQQVVGRVMLVRLDRDGRPVTKNGEVVVSEPSMVRIDAQGNLLLDSALRAAFVAKEENGKLCVPDLGSPKDAPIVEHDGVSRPIVAPRNADLDPGCVALPPAVRLATNGLVVGANYAHTNLAGDAFSPDFTTPTAVKTIVADTYQAGGGYVGKRFVADVLSVLQNDRDGYRALERQGTSLDTFLVNPFTVSATVSGGRALENIDGKFVESTNGAPFYAVSVNYTLNVQDILTSVLGVGHPADQGYVYHGVTPDGHNF